jgi:hypothetical protein
MYFDSRYVAGHRYGIFIEDAPEAGIRRGGGLIEDGAICARRFDAHLVRGLTQRQEVEDRGEREHDVGHPER